jgi:putative two-component system response regulator
MKTIFVVDDNEVNLTMAKQILERHYRTLTMMSAAKMFGLLEKINPDLILLDLEMPITDGLAAYDILRANSQTKFTPVIFLTAYQNDALEEMCRNKGAADFITKPFTADDLLKRVSRRID